MSKVEATVIGLVIGLLCPAALFVLFWWMAAAVAIYNVLPVTDSCIAIAAFTGLAAGLALDVLYLKRWTSRFYHAGAQCMVLVYLFWSAVAVAFFMGLPFGNLVLGTLAGLYVGRRQHHAGASTDVFASAARNASVFTALVTGVEALPIGLLALREGIVLETLRATAGLAPSAASGPLGVVLVITLSVLLVVIQFASTHTAAVIAFRPGRQTEPTPTSLS